MSYLHLTTKILSISILYVRHEDLYYRAFLPNVFRAVLTFMKYNERDSFIIKQIETIFGWALT